MKTTISYADIEDRDQRDWAAIKDIKDYLSEKQWDVFCEEARDTHTAQDFQKINFYMGFVGIEGFPVHAFGRRYCLEAYRAWMMSSEGGDPILVDEQGFLINLQEGE